MEKPTLCEYYARDDNDKLKISLLKTVCIFVTISRHLLTNADFL